MAFSFVNAVELDDPLMGFRFGVFFLGAPLGLAHPLDFRFQEVSGLEVSIKTSSVEAMGEGENSRQLPGEPDYGQLELKRGMPVFSTLRFEVLDSLRNSKTIARNVLVSVLDENALPLNSWLFKEAYPVHWSISTLNANSDQLIIETMKLTYSNFQPFSL